jgi:putative DNA primase/helicase
MNLQLIVHNSELISNENNDSKSKAEFIKPKTDCSLGLFLPINKDNYFYLENVGNHLKAIFYINYLEDNSVALLLEFTDQQNKLRTKILPRSKLDTQVNTFQELLKYGYQFNPKYKKKIYEYLQKQGSGLPIKKITKLTGWVEDSYLMPHKTYGNQELQFKTPQSDENSLFIPKGTLEKWKNNIAKLASSSPYIIFAIGCAFASTLLTPLKLPSIGFHFYGQTSIGKTTLLRISASVVGDPSKIVTQWRTTSSALESTAQEYNDRILFLDEFGQVDPKDIGNTIYMLANGQGKARANRSGDRTPMKTWKLFYLSTGEVSFRQKMDEGGNSIKGGQEIRFLDILIEAEKHFESLGEYKSSSELIDALSRASESFYGTAMDAYLTNLVQLNTLEWVEKQQSELENLKAELIKNYSDDNVIGRVSKHFAVVQLALKLSQEWNIVPFTSKEIKNSIKTIFNVWLDNRGGAGNIEIKRRVEYIKFIFQSRIHSNRIVDLSENGFKSTGNSNLLAYKKNNELWVPVNIFKNEFAKGVNEKELLKELENIRLFIPSKEKDRNTSKRQFQGKRQSFYIFKNDFEFEILAHEQLYNSLDIEYEN